MLGELGELVFGELVLGELGKLGKLGELGVAGVGITSGAGNGSPSIHHFFSPLMMVQIKVLPL